MLPEIHNQYQEILELLELLELDPHHPSLRFHNLSGRLKDLSSVSINLTHRITLELKIRDKEIILVNVGDHDQVY